MALYVGLDVSLKTTSICVVDADGTVIWRGKLRANRRLGEGSPASAGPGHPLSEWLYGALVESGFKTVCIETRHAQCFLLSGPNKTNRSDARGIADMIRFGHYRPVHGKSKTSQLMRTVAVRRDGQDCREGP